MNRLFTITKNGITLSVKRIKNRTLPHLVVEFSDDEQNVATFKDENTAKWFVEIMKEFFAEL
jgi:hypothetical protein